jgi:diphthamide synthase (EF-2-diphthine--ammonia ligase)
LQQDPDVEVIGLFTTINKAFNRVAMHAVRVQLLAQQADRTGLPLHLIEIPSPCSNREYQQAMTAFIEKASLLDTDCFAFGDLFLEDIRQYRITQLEGTGIAPVFPIRGIATDELSRTMINNGLKAVITCVDPAQLPAEFVGRAFDACFLADLPDTVDPCGENGEFHSFVHDAPCFHTAVDIKVGEIVTRDGFVFADVTGATD